MKSNRLSKVLAISSVIDDLKTVSMYSVFRSPEPKLYGNRNNRSSGKSRCCRE